MNTMNLFEDLTALEPKCPKCESIIKLGETTKFDIQKKAHICLSCGCVLK